MVKDDKGNFNSKGRDFTLTKYYNAQIKTQNCENNIGQNSINVLHMLVNPMFYTHHIKLDYYFV